MSEDDGMQFHPAMSDLYSFSNATSFSDFYNFPSESSFEHESFTDDK
jgi:hypothetical protein